MDDLIFKWRENEAIQLPTNLTLPQFKILGYKLNSCTKKYDTGTIKSLLRIFFVFNVSFKFRSKNS